MSSRSSRVTRGTKTVPMPVRIKTASGTRTTSVPVKVTTTTRTITFEP